MAIKNISMIHKKNRHLIDEVDNEFEGIGVWLKRPYIFSSSNSSCTFFNYDDFEDDEHPKLSALVALNKCIEDEAEKVSFEHWDRG